MASLTDQAKRAVRLGVGATALFVAGVVVITQPDWAIHTVTSMVSGTGHGLKTAYDWVAHHGHTATGH